MERFIKGKIFIKLSIIKRIPVFIFISSSDVLKYIECLNHANRLNSTEGELTVVAQVQLGA